MESSQGSRPKEILLYFSLSFAYIGLVYVASEWFLEASAYMIAVLSVIISVPIMATYGYHMAIRRIFLRFAIKETSKIYSFLSGFLSRIAVSFILSVFTSYYLILSIIGSSRQSWYLWGAVVVSVPLMLAAYKAFIRIVKYRLEDFLHNSVGMFGASLSVSIFLTICFATAANYGVERPLLDSYQCALKAQLTCSGAHPIVRLFCEAYRFSNAANDFVLSILRAASEVPNVWYISVYLLNTFLFFVGFTSVIAIFLVGWKEVISRVLVEPDPKAYGSKRIRRRIIALVAAVSLFGFYFYLLFGPIERIGDNNVFAGTKERIIDREESRQDELSTVMASAYANTIEPEIRAAFETVKGNVPNFLDWYYSLPADFGRILLAVSGKLDQDISDKMLEHLTKDDPFRDLTAKLEVLDQVEGTLNERARQEIEQMIASCTVDPSKDYDSRIVRSMSGAEIGDIVAVDTIPFSARLGVSLGSGSIAFVVGSGIVSRAIARGTIKNASQVIVKAVSRAAGVRIGTVLGGVAVGGAAGGAAGLPGIVAGAVVGAGVALLADYGLLKLEEYLSRDKLEGEIMEAIEIEEREVLLEAGRLLRIDN